MLNELDDLNEFTFHSFVGHRVYHSGACAYGIALAHDGEKILVLMDTSKSVLSIHPDALKVTNWRGYKHDA